MKRHYGGGSDVPGYLNPMPYQDKVVIDLLITLLYEERDSKSKYKKNLKKYERELSKAKEELADVKAILLDVSRHDVSPESSVSGEVGPAEDTRRVVCDIPDSAMSPSASPM